jgi:hypothetical protein
MDSDVVQLKYDNGMDDEQTMYTLSILSRDV